MTDTKNSLLDKHAKARQIIAEVIDEAGQLIKENERLTAENTDLQADVASLEDQLAFVRSAPEGDEDERTI